MPRRKLDRANRRIARHGRSLGLKTTKTGPPAGSAQLFADTIRFLVNQRAQRESEFKSIAELVDDYITRSSRQHSTTSWSKAWFGVLAARRKLAETNETPKLEKELTA
jgi:hypothetical protein